MWTNGSPGDRRQPDCRAGRARLAAQRGRRYAADATRGTDCRHMSTGSEAASHRLIAFSSIASNTGLRSPGDELMTCNTSAVAVCCSRASSRSAVRSASRRRNWAFLAFEFADPVVNECVGLTPARNAPGTNSTRARQIAKQPPAATLPCEDRRPQTLQNRCSANIFPARRLRREGRGHRPRTARRRDRAAASRAGVGDRARHPRGLGQARHARSGLAAETAAHRRLSSTSCCGPARGSERPGCRRRRRAGGFVQKPARIVATIDAAGNFAEFVGLVLRSWRGGVRVLETYS